VKILIILGKVFTHLLGALSLLAMLLALIRIKFISSFFAWPAQQDYHFFHRPWTPYISCTKTHVCGHLKYTENII